jgi:hypothetical protein
MLDVEALSEMMAGIIAEEVGKAVAPLNSRLTELESRPAPEKGEKGETGENGLDGKDGVDGRDGQDGRSVTAEDVSALVAEQVVKAVANIPVPRDGTDGKDGADGRGVRSLLIDRNGELVATMDDGETKALGPVIGKDGAPGKDGRDGFGLDDFDCQPIDERTIKMTFVRGEVAHSYELQFPVVVYRGVFRDGQDYERGDMVTWAGSLWHCDSETKDKPGTDSWTLAAKKGRDGKDAK